MTNLFHLSRYWRGIQEFKEIKHTMIPAYSSFSTYLSCNQTNSSCSRTTENSVDLNSGSVVYNQTITWHHLTNLWKYSTGITNKERINFAWNTTFGFNSGSREHDLWTYFVLWSGGTEKDAIVGEKEEATWRKVKQTFLIFIEESMWPPKNCIWRLVLVEVKKDTEDERKMTKRLVKWRTKIIWGESAFLDLDF